MQHSKDFQIKLQCKIYVEQTKKGQIKPRIVSFTSPGGKF